MGRHIMEKFLTAELILSEYGETHLVSMKGLRCLPSWLVHTQIELDGNRVFVRRVDTTLGGNQDNSADLFGIVVSPVY